MPRLRVRLDHRRRQFVKRSVRDNQQRVSEMKRSRNEISSLVLSHSQAVEHDSAVGDSSVGHQVHVLVRAKRSRHRSVSAQAKREGEGEAFYISQ